MAAKNQPIDFKAIAAAALGSAEQLLSEWLPQGKRAGHEFKSINPTRGDSASGSFSINIKTGAWADFATDDSGGDLISLCAYLFHLGDQGAAARELAERFNIEVPPLKGDSSPRKARPPVADPVPAEPKKARTEWIHVIPVPDDAPPAPVAHYARGRPEATWDYRDGAGRVIGYIYRFITSDGGKETLPVSYCQHPETGVLEWRWLSFPEPRPLYGLDRLAQKPDAWVLLVEGEKCADAPVDLLKNAVVMSWPGGCKAVDKVDWAPLKGCNVILWPDADAQREKLTLDERNAGVDPRSKPIKPLLEQPGTIAMERIARYLANLGEGTRARIVKLPEPGIKPDGWDVYDAINTDGMDAPALVEFCKHLRDPAPLDSDTPADPPDTAQKKKPKRSHTPKSATAEDMAPPDDEDWYGRLIKKRGELISCLSNVYDMLDNSPEWKGVVAFDESAQRTVKLTAPPFKGGVAGEWEDQDDARAAMWLGRKFYFAPSQSQIRDAVDVLSRENSFHPIQKWLKGITWDGVPRIEDWMFDYLGVPKTDYSMKVARWYLMGMVARAMNPGCKFDYCLVLEGDQGLRKSGVLSVLGGEWYGDTDLNLDSKDSMDAIRGKWVYEFAEMGSVTRAESSKQKSFITRQIDEFRPAYGTRSIRCPRQVVFAGTINEWEWNKDPTGGRRFWPVKIINEIDHIGLGKVREQLFAEAFQLWLAGEKYWPTREEQRDIFDPVQLASAMQESFVDILAPWVDLQVVEFSLAYAVKEGLGIDASKLTRDIQTRAGHALRVLGCTRVEKRTNAIRYWYKPPEKKSLSIVQIPSDPSDEDDDIPYF